MAARSIASLTISFGMVSIPVKLYSATEASRAISFNLLHKACGSRLKQQYFCVKEEVPVPREDMAKGYEFAKDQHVEVEPGELDKLRTERDKAIGIDAFVGSDAVDRIGLGDAELVDALAHDRDGAVERGGVELLTLGGLRLQNDLETANSTLRRLERFWGTSMSYATR